jgi:osmotically-inducible protein OsmY
MKPVVLPPQARKSRRALLLALSFATALPLLQGCFPLAVTGVGATAALAADRRTSGTYVDDESIEWKASDRIRKEFGTNNHVNVTSYNRVLLLTGEVQDEGRRAEIERLLSSLEQVRRVVNETVVAPPSSLTARGNDMLITSNVKARLVDSERVSAHTVKVVTEANVVFLMGLVTRTEADVASEIARKSRGVSKVVRVFEYISDEEARRHSSRNEAPAN